MLFLQNLHKQDQQYQYIHGLTSFRCNCFWEFFFKWHDIHMNMCRHHLSALSFCTHILFNLANESNGQTFTLVLCQLNSQQLNLIKCQVKFFFFFFFYYFWKLTMLNTCNEIAYGQCNRPLYLCKPISIYLSANPLFTLFISPTKPCKVGFTAWIYRRNWSCENYTPVSVIKNEG